MVNKLQILTPGRIKSTLKQTVLHHYQRESVRDIFKSTSYVILNNISQQVRMVKFTRKYQFLPPG